MKFKLIFLSFVLIGVLGFAKSAWAGVIFQDDFESDPSNWMCRNSATSTYPWNALSHWRGADMTCGWTDGFGAQWKMGPGHNSNNAIYNWEKYGVPNGYWGENQKWLYGSDIKQEIYQRWYMKFPTPQYWDKLVSGGMKFWRYVTREDGYTLPPEVYLNAYGGFTMQTCSLQMHGEGNVGWRILTPLSDFNDNQWHCHEIRLKLNSNGASDGVIQYWLDGVLKATYTGLYFDKDPAAGDLKIHRFGIGVGNVGDADWNQTEWGAVGFDDIVVSTDYIGCNQPPGPIQTDVTPPAAPTGVAVQ